jgi:hypothetical protein
MAAESAIKLKPDRPRRMENSPVEWFPAPTPTNVIVGAAFDQPTNGSINWQAADQWSHHRALNRPEI